MELIFQWPNFKIDLSSMSNYLATELEHFDGIVALEETFQVMKLSDVVLEDFDKVTEYLEALTEEGERIKLERPSKIEDSFNRCQAQLLEKTYDQMSVLERKIVLRMPLTDEDIDLMLQLY